MAHSLQSDFKIYQEYFDAGFVEVLQQNGAAFNGASQGAIQLRQEILKGNFAYDSFFDVVSGLVARRDTTSTSTASDTPLTMDEFVSVKLDRKVGPIGVSLDAMKKKARDPREVSFILGQQTATAVQLEQLNTALLACEAALDNIAALEHDASGPFSCIEFHLRCLVRTTPEAGLTVMVPAQRSARFPPDQIGARPGRGYTAGSTFLRWTSYRPFDALDVRRSSPILTISRGVSIVGAHWPLAGWESLEQIR